ncbi:hypothetical protein AKO1_001836 [Acrasis kona]|uniref:Uncharacterized protein n=1 Tax=Acrasis kona TaxID=1008807 RepID=A0AAW2ZC10_9EUKA
MNNKRSNVFARESKIDNLQIFKKKFEQQDKPFWKMKEGWIENPQTNAQINRDKQNTHNHLRQDSKPSYLVQKQEKRKELSDKVNNVPVVNNSGTSFGRIALWNADYYVNERSPLDDPNKPMYSSFSHDKVFDPSRRCRQDIMNKHERRKQNNEQIDVSEYLYKPFSIPIPNSITVKNTKTSGDRRMSVDIHKHPYDQDYDDNLSIHSHATESSIRSNGSTATILSSVSRTSSISTPRTWSVSSSKQRSSNPMSNSIQSKSSGSSVVLRPPSAGRSRPSSSSWVSRPVSARITTNVPISSSLDKVSDFEPKKIMVQELLQDVDARSSSSCSTVSAESDSIDVNNYINNVDDDIVSYEPVIEVIQEPPPVAVVENKPAQKVNSAPIMPKSNVVSSNISNKQVITGAPTLTRVARKEINTVTTKPFRAHSPNKEAAEQPSAPVVQSAPLPIVNISKRPTSASTSRRASISQALPMSPNTARGHKDRSRSICSNDSSPNSSPKPVPPNKSKGIL